MSDGGADEYKTKGNAAFKAGDWEEAIKNYNKAIQLDPDQAAFYSNRAACWSSKGNHESALSDSKKCLEKDPNFIKGYSRKGKALFDMNNLDEAEAAYREGLEKDESNAGCKSGVEDVQRARAHSARARQSQGGSGGIGSMFSGLMGGGIGGLGKKAMDMMKGGGGRGGRMQMYAMLAMGYFMFNSFTKRSGSSSSSATAGHDTEDDPMPSDDSPEPLRRSFSKVDGTWLSFVEAGNRGDSLLVFLHRTSLSAEGEYSAAIGRVLEKSTPKGGLRILAPDRPCHGYSPCSPTKAGSVGNWLDGLLTTRPKSKKLTIVASGRSAIQQALALAHERMQPSRLLLVNPSMSSPGRGSMADPMADSAELQKWLAEQQKAGIATAASAADAARWAVAAKGDESEEEDDKLVASGMPEGSQITTLYSEGEDENTDLKEELEGLGLSVKVRRAPGGDGMLDALVAEAWRMAVGASDAEEEDSTQEF